MAIGCSFISAISAYCGYFINGYSIIGGYSINGYWWLFY
jgi:hypothetical protein